VYPKSFITQENVRTSIFHIHVKVILQFSKRYFEKKFNKPDFYYRVVP